METFYEREMRRIRQFYMAFQIRDAVCPELLAEIERDKQLLEQNRRTR